MNHQVSPNDSLKVSIEPITRFKTKEGIDRVDSRYFG
jgi:hypothetical protein